MSTTVAVYGEDKHVGGLPVGNPEFRYDDVLGAQDSNSNTWPTDSLVRITTPRRLTRLVIIETDTPLEVAVTYMNETPDSVVAMPVRPATGGRVAYSLIVEGGRAKVWTRRID